MFEGFGWKSSWKKEKKFVQSFFFCKLYTLVGSSIWKWHHTVFIYSFLLGWMFSSPRRRLFHGLFSFLSQFWDSAFSFSYSFGYCRFTLWISEGGGRKKKKHQRLSIFSIIIAVCVAQAGAPSVPHASSRRRERQNSREIFSPVFSFLLLPRMFRFFSLGRLGIVGQDIYKLTLCSSVDMSDIYGWHNPPLFTMRNSVRRSHNSQVCGLHRSESYDAGENYLWGQTLFRECRIDPAKNCSETAPEKVGCGVGGRRRKSYGFIDGAKLVVRNELEWESS